MTYDEIVERLGGIRNGVARCPAHDDHNPSLSVSETNDGTILIRCHAGCSVNDVLAAIGLTVKDLFARRNGHGDEILATYDYVDEAGKLLYQVVRKIGKKFVCRRPDGAGGWIYKTAQVRRVLYGLPSVLEAVAAGRAVWIVEGEKDADRLSAEGVTATCNPHGAGKWGKVPDAPEILTGANVIIVADRDEPGYAHARDIAGSLVDKASSIVVVEAATGKDVSDHLAGGHDLEEFAVIAGTGPDDSPLDVWLSLSPSESDAHPHTPPTDAPLLAHDLQILDKFKEAVVCAGVVGEVRTACTLFLLITSRLLDKPVSCVVKGHSSSGKSFTTETVLRFFPREAFLEFTAMSQRALVYSTEQYAHRTLVIYEIVALREGVEDDLTAYFVRSLLSEGRISYPVTVRDKHGNFTTKTIVKEGPTNMIVTTTKTKVHAENETRVLSLSTDDTREQTKAIFAALANEDGDTPDFEQWQRLQLWLQTQAERRVTIPYRAELAELVEPVAIRLRRDFGALLNLIRTHAIVHQLSRERDGKGRIIATIDDYDAVRDLVGDLISEAVGNSVTETVRATVDKVAELAPGHKDGVTARVLADHLGLDRSTVSRRLSVAASGGYLKNLEDKKGRPGRWLIGDPLPGDIDILPTREVLEGKCNAQAHR